MVTVWKIPPHRLIVVEPTGEIKQKLKELYRKRAKFELYLTKDGCIWIYYH